MENFKQGEKAIKRKNIYQKTGNYHITNGLPNQDFVWEAENEIIKAVIIADGVSTCKNSLKGAETACKAIAEILLDDAEYIFASDKEKTAGLIVAYIYKKLLIEANAQNENVESFSSTLSFVCFNKVTRNVLTFVLGDSLIYGVGKDSFRLIGSPVFFEGNGTFTTTTQGVESCVDINIFSEDDFSRFILCTDGAWRTFYKSGILKEDVSCVMKSENLISVKNYFDAQNCFDDCSCIIMNI